MSNEGRGMRNVFLTLAIVLGCAGLAGASWIDYVDPLIGTESKRADAANAAGMQKTMIMELKRGNGR